MVEGKISLNNQIQAVNGSEIQLSTIYDRF